MPTRKRKPKLKTWNPPPTEYPPWCDTPKRKLKMMIYKEGKFEALVEKILALPKQGDTVTVMGWLFIVEKIIHRKTGTTYYLRKRKVT